MSIIIDSSVSTCAKYLRASDATVFLTIEHKLLSCVRPAEIRPRRVHTKFIIIIGRLEPP
jgi:hypothetical protein